MLILQGLKLHQALNKFRADEMLVRLLGSNWKSIEKSPEGSMAKVFSHKGSGGLHQIHRSSMQQPQ